MDEGWLISSAEDSYSSNVSAHPSCLNFSREMRLIAHIARPAIASLGAVVSFLVAVVILFVLREYKRFGYRLVVYLMVSTFLVGVSQAFGVLPLDQSTEDVHVKDGWGVACAFIGYLDQVSAWLEHLVIAWITVFLLMMVFQRPYTHSVKYEVVGVVMWLGVPLVICWLPFANGVYGLSGLWCWIKVTNEDCSKTYIAGFIYQFLIYYGPFTLLVLFNATSFIAIAVFLCKRGLLSRGTSEEAGTPTTGLSTLQRQALRQTLPLLFYPMIYDVLLALQVTNRIVYAVAVSRSMPPNYPLWIVHIVVDSSRTVYPPLAFLLHPGTIRSIYNAIVNRSAKKREETTTNHTAYIVKNEFSDEFSEEDGQPLIVKGTLRKPTNELLQFSGNYLAVNS